MKDDRPNILIIHCHDLGRWLPTYGMTSVPAPNVTALAEQSTVFTAAHATAPLCTPARSSLFTGLLPHQNGLMGLTHAGWLYRPGVRTLPELLRDHGYHSVLVGLQHEDLDPRVLGYDEVHGLGFLPRALEVASRAAWWFDQPRGGEPFLLTVGLWEVHRPWPVEDYEPADPAGVDVPAYLPDNDDTREDISRFHGAIRQMDEAVGYVLGALERSGLADDTLVVFTTDHGAAFPRAKSTLYDSGVGVALVVRTPPRWGLPPQVSADLVSHLDVVPTLVEVAGGEPGEELEGESLLPLLRGEGTVDEERELYLEKTFHDRYDPIRALRTKDAKYIRNYSTSPWAPYAIDLEESPTRRGMGPQVLQRRPEEELYLLADDPSELRDLAEQPQHQELKAHLAGRLDQHMRRTLDPLLEGEVPPPPTPSREDRSAARAPGAD